MADPLDRLPGGFLAFTDDGKIVRVNKPLAAIFGYGEDDLCDKHVETLFTVASRIFYQTHILPLLKMQGHLSEIYVACRTKSGEELPILLNAVRSDVDGKVHNECLLTPMRRRSEFEDELIKARNIAQRANEEKARLLETLNAAHRALEQQQVELKEKNAELQSLRDSLEARVVERTEELRQLVLEMQSFTYSIAHDLRAPLRAIVAASSVLVSEAGDQLSAEGMGLLERQRLNALKLSSLVDDLLELSRMAFTSFNHEHVDLAAITEQQWRKVIKHYPSVSIRLDLDPDLEAKGDRAMLLLLLENLLDNAVKYSPAGGTVTVGAKLHEGETAYFVRDEGIGIDPAYHEKIFQPFQRLHRDQDYPGNGIGLASVERIVKRHGGRVWVDSTPGVGSTFYFTLG